MATEIFNWNVKQVYHWLLISVYGVCLLGTSIGNEQTFMEADNECSCPNDILSYTCTVIGGAATVWEGSAFDCQTGGIVLRHSAFSGGTSGSCNDGAIVGRSIGSVDNCYSSQLNITLNLEMNNKTIQCQGMNRVGGVTLSVVSVVPPNSVSLTGVNEGNLTFNWTPASSNCLSYQINFDCGSCPSMPQATSVNCSDLQLLAIERLCTFRIQSVCRSFVGNQNKSVGVMLKAPDIPNIKITPIYNAETRILSRIDFEIQEEAPFNITNGISSSVESYNISYCCDDNDKVNASIHNLPSNGVIKFRLSNCFRNNVSVYISAISGLGEGQSSDPYTTGCNNTFVVVKYISNTSSISCMFLNKSDTSNKSCSVMYGKCNELNANNTEYGINNTILVTLNIDIFQSYCYEVTASSGTDTVTVEGKITGIGRRDTVFRVATVVVPLVCVLFLAITLGVLLPAVLYLMLQRKSKDQSQSRSHTHQKELESSSLLSDKEFTPPIVVESKLSSVPSSPTKTTEDSPTRVPSTEATAPSTEAMALSSEAEAPPTMNDCTNIENAVPSSADDELAPATPPDDKCASSDGGLVQKIFGLLRQPNLKNITDRNFEIHVMVKDCELREYVGEKFTRGCAFYEMCPEGEIIFEDQELIFVKDSEYFYPPDHYKVQLHQGVFIKPPADYQVFVQCIGSGARYLSAKSSILLHKTMNNEQPYNVEKLSWRRVISDQFQVLNVEKGMPLDAFCKEHSITSTEVGNIFLEFATFCREFKDGGEIIDVVLMTEDRKYFTGPKARCMVRQYYKTIGESSVDPPLDQHKNIQGEKDTDYLIVDKLDAMFKKVFVLTKLKKGIQLRAKEDILCQNQHQYALESTFVVLEVDQDYVQMCEFVQQKLQITFENGNVFYRLSKEGEDLLYYKDILHPPALNDKTTNDELRLRMKIKWYYALGAPGEKIKSGKNLFVQSNSDGSRCLKRGTKILYKINDDTFKECEQI